MFRLLKPCPACPLLHGHGPLPLHPIPLLVPLLNILFAIAGSGAACIACGSKWYFDLAGSKYHFDPHL